MFLFRNPEQLTLLPNLIYQPLILLTLPEVNPKSLILNLILPNQIRMNQISLSQTFRSQKSLLPSLIILLTLRILALTPGIKNQEIMAFLNLTQKIMNNL